jgi:AraC-like DNA-binding protein
MATMVDTAAVAPADRKGYWAEASSRMFVPLEFDPAPRRPFAGWMRGGPLADVQLCELAATPHMVARTPRLVDHTDGSYYKLNFVVEGSMVVRQDGRETLIGSGDFTICDCSRPYAIDTRTPLRLLICMLPQSALSISPERMSRITATSVPGGHGVGWLLAPFLDRLSRLAQADAVTSEIESAAQSAVSLVENLCSAQLRQRSGLDASARDELARRMREYIDAHLGDPDLTPDRIAAEHYVSRRYLYKLFAADGVSVSRWIRERRLERCRRDLANPALGDQSVSAIALRHGFTDPAHFSRLFRAAYGCTPSQYRRDAA